MPLSKSKPSAQIAIRQEYGWVRALVPGGTSWFKGYVMLDRRCLLGTEAAAHLAGTLTGLPPEEAGKTLQKADGHFAFACQWDSGRVLIAVDRMRSVPLAYARGVKGWIIDDQALRLQREVGAEEPDPNASLELAMAGYTLGKDTLYREIKQLQTGELAIFVDPKSNPAIYRYDRYRAWRVELGFSSEDWLSQLESITERLFAKMAESLNGRKVMLPLSAGLDSRLVASGLKHVGYRNVHCYAYGLPGNFEAAASREIAARLGYPWTFVPYTRAAVRSCAATPEFRKYLDFADTLCAVPFVQDFLAIRTLRNTGLVPDDAVFINGNSGDFISGGHIQPQMFQPRFDLDTRGLHELIVETTLSKHFTLWRDLMGAEHKERVRSRLQQLIDSCEPENLTPETAHGVYECLECESRQAKYVISGQRVYEFYGFEWRLPLWDVLYLNFWSRVPLRHKVSQNLYIDFLQHADWGGVWKGYAPRRWVSPTWVRPLRAACKLACVPFGRHRWHMIEKRIFTYFTDILCTHSTVPVPYSRFLTYQRGHRHSMAFRCEDYLLGKGRAMDGSLP